MVFFESILLTDSLEQSQCLIWSTFNCCFSFNLVFFGNFLSVKRMLAGHGAFIIITYTLLRLVYVMLVISEALDLNMHSLLQILVHCIAVLFVM